MRSNLILPALAFLPVLLAVAAPTTTPSTRPAIESKAVEKDNVAVTLVMTKTTISTDEQPEFIVRFKNIGKEEYRNLYDVTAYWNWTIELTDTDPLAVNLGPWRLHMNAIPLRAYLDHRQIKPGESADVSVNLNDSPFTFDYVYARPVDHEIPPVRHLKPGHYQVSTKVLLTNPFGSGYFEWIGPVTTAGIDLTVTQASPETVTKEQQAAYDAAIVRVTNKLQSGGPWLNGGYPKIDLPKNAKPEDVIDAAVNNTLLDSKAYRVLSLKTFARNSMPAEISGMAALLQVGKSYKAVIFFPTEATGWWSRF
jgi:hypothetical protein